MFGKFFLDISSNIIFGFKNVVQNNFRYRSTNSIKNISHNLVMRIGKFVVGIVHMLLCYLKLNNNNQFNEHVIPRLGFTCNIELLNA